MRPSMALLALAFVLVWPGAARSQTSVEAVDRFAAARLRAPVLLDAEALELVPDTIAPPDYRAMALAGAAMAGASLYLTWTLLDEEYRVFGGLSLYATIPGTVLIPMVVHSANGGRGNVIASLGASAVTWAASFFVSPVYPLAPVIQIPVAMLIETATMNTRQTP